MGALDRDGVKELFGHTFMKKIFDKAYLIDLDSRCCMELVVADLTTMNPLHYDDWLISFAQKMYRPDTAAFFAQMDLNRICLFLSKRHPRYVVYCRRMDNTGVREYQLNISYTGEDQMRLVILREELTRDGPRPLETVNELTHSNSRFQFLVNRLTENFIEINIETGACRMYHADNGMQTYDTFKEQIAWWAEHFIVPEEREAYIKEYELAGLTRSLRANNGIHSATYTTLSGNTKNNLLINSTLVKEAYGRKEEYIFAYSQDITLLKVQETRNKQLLTLSQTDPVTGLLNRSACEKMIEEHLAAATNDTPGTMLLIDIDHFKEFNDLYGHSTGDYVLRFLGKMMQDIFRSDDIVSRWGGDEFVVFMRGVYGRKMIESRIERLRIRLRQCKKDGQSLPITISIGGKVATAEMTRKHLFDDCDKALYQVKAQGRDDYFIHLN